MSKPNAISSSGDQRGSAVPLHVRTLLVCRRLWRSSMGWLLLACLATLWTKRAEENVSTYALAGSGLLLGFIFVRSLLRYRNRRTLRSAKWDRFLSAIPLLEGFSALLFTTFALRELYGFEWLQPFLFALVATFSIVAAARVPWPLTAALAMSLELFFGGQSSNTWIYSAFYWVFAGFHSVASSAAIRMAWTHAKAELEKQQKKIDDDSKLFRLVSSTGDSAASDEKLFRSSVTEVHSATYHVLRLLKKTLDLHTCVLLFSGEDEKLRIVELVSDSEDIDPGPFSEGEGVLGAVCRRGIRTKLHNLRLGYRGIPYYQGGSIVGSFVGIPVVENGRRVGVLCADRLKAEPFNEEEEMLLAESVGEILRSLQNERIFVQLEKSKREQSMLFRATQELGAARTQEEVVRVVFDSVKRIANVDLLALSRYDSHTKRHSIAHAEGMHAESIKNLSFKTNHSLVAMAVKNRHFLPYRGDYRPNHQVAFTKRKALQNMKSLIVLPLLAGDNAIGTLTLAAEEAGVFSAEKRRSLQMLASQSAVALSNADAMKSLEQMATTDGLTGCLNKRAFLKELETRLRSAERFGKRLSLIVTDIDHFKSVNDTYGHATGDVVIKELGALLLAAKRDTDVVARFGGEEFCVLCEETDTEGAVHLAERIREELRTRSFETEVGTLQVTASLGVATFPEHATTAQGLFEESDRALYAAKHAGRNQVAAA